MRIKYYPAILSFLLLIPSLKTLPQSFGEPAIDSVSALFTKFIQTNTNKNTVLFTDRSVYMAGEKIWFKAYVVNEVNGKPDLTSRNLFADLVNEKDSIIEQLVLDNTSLQTAGAFRLPGSLPTGFYWIRCYTARQLKGDSNEIFLHPVYIVNRQLHDERIYAKQFENNLANNRDLKPVIHFFAERLTAIPGIISTGVIEIRDGHDNPLSAKCDLVNGNDSIIASFKTNSLGLARLTFVNDSAEKYTAVFHLNEHITRYQLPTADKNSIQLSATNQTAKTIKAFVTLEDAVPADIHTTILAVQRDSLYYAAVGTGNYGITIPVDHFPGGIVRLLLFDEKSKLLSERKIYIPKENVELEITPDKKKYAEREKAVVHIKVTGPNGKPLESVLTVAVEDERIEKFSGSIEANTLPPSGEFLLNSWLNRYHLKYTADDIDLLMVIKKSIFQQPPDTGSNNGTRDYDDNKKLKNIIGKITDKKGNGITGRIVSTIAKNNRAFFMDVGTTGKDGMFSLLIPPGFDSLQLSLQVTDQHQLPTFSDSIKIDSFRYPFFSTPLSLKQQFLANNINTLALLQKYQADTTIRFQGRNWLTPVTVTARKKEELNYDASKRINSISQILTRDKFRYGGSNALGNAILMVPGVTLSFGDISIFGPDMDFAGHISRPLIIMDGYALTTGNVIEFLNSLNPAEIDFIEVLRGGEAGIYGVRGGAGVISINTKHGPDKSYNSHHNLRLFTPVTYHVCPRFEMPDYSNKEIKNSSIPDSRTTIYWDGNIITDANGEADINFYTADDGTNYTITITGLTANGHTVYKRVTIGNTGKSGSIK